MMSITLFFIVSVLITGLIALLDRFFLAKRRRGQASWIVDTAKSAFPILLVVFLVRSFIIQPYRVPTGSLEPTVLPGDFIFVNQFAYGLRLPVLGKKILAYGKPDRGDIALFYWPLDTRQIYVKRVIGLPGDHVAYHHKVLFINGKEADQTLVETPGLQSTSSVVRKKEQLLGKEHMILVSLHSGDEDFDVDVPKGHYFMMGDHRDASYDSRYWGFVSDHHLIGKAWVVWMSWDATHHRLRWQRIGKVLH